MVPRHQAGSRLQEGGASSKTSFSVDDTFKFAPGQVRFVSLLPSGSSGTATVVSSNYAGGSSFQELSLHNIGMRLVLDDTVPTAKSSGD